MEKNIKSRQVKSNGESLGDKIMLGVSIVSAIALIWFVVSVANINSTNLSPGGQIADWNMITNTMNLFNK